MTSTVDDVIGAMGTDLDGPAIRALCDADGAVVFEQARWARAACVITRQGWPLRVTDIGHATRIAGVEFTRLVRVCGAVCEVCGQPWPCSSAISAQAALYGPGAQYWLACVPAPMAADEGMIP